MHTLGVLITRGHLDRERERSTTLNTITHIKITQATRSKMLFRKTIHRTKNFFHKTLENIKSFLFGGYQKLPKATPFNPISSITTNNPKMQHLDNFYREFSEHWESDCNSVMRKRKKSTVISAKEENESSRNFLTDEIKQNVVENTTEDGEREEDSFHEGKRRCTCSESDNRGGHVLAQRMKEIEMMDVNDVDHVLDIEEVLHYYSRLTSPVYLDLVDKFFMEMYSEFLHLQPSMSVNSSMRRLSPVKH